MITTFTRLSRVSAVHVGLALSVSQIAAWAQTEARESTLYGSDETLVARTDAGSTCVDSARIVFVGRVVNPDGSPREGAVVLSSAGGKAVTDARGEYRL